MNDQPPAVCFKIPLQSVEVNITSSKHNNHTTVCRLIEPKHKLSVPLYKQRRAALKHTTGYVIWMMSSVFFVAGHSIGSQTKT